jgi:molybdopterin converting factor small subunit
VEFVVHLFGPARDAAGTGRATVVVEPPATAAAVVAALGAAYPRLAPLLPRSRVAVNHGYVEAGAALAAGDEVAIVPPVGGG